MTAPEELSTIPFSARHSSLQLDYLPPVKPATTAQPFIFYIHGGGYLAGDRHTAPAYLYGLAKGLDLPFVSVDYRLCPEASLEDGVEDVKEAWRFVTASQGGLAEKTSGVRFDPSRAIIIGVSAGSLYAVDLLLSLSATKAPRPLAFVNFYGSVHLDPDQLSTPRAAPHPLLDQPGGFAPLDAFVDSRFTKTPDGKWSVKTLADQPTGSHLSFLEGLKANGHITDVDDFYAHLWQANGLSRQLFEETNAGKNLITPRDGDFEPLCRVLLLFWAFRNGTLGTCLDGPNPSSAVQEESKVRRQHLKTIATQDGLSFPPTISVHGTADVLVPHTLSELFNATLASRSVDSTLVLIDDEIHGLDMKWVFGQSSKIGNVGGGGQHQEQLEEWIRRQIAA